MINIIFDTYITLIEDNEENEFLVSVEAAGEILEDGYADEFGYDDKMTADKVEIVSIFNPLSQRMVLWGELKKSDKKKLLELASEKLLDDETMGFYE